MLAPPVESLAEWIVISAELTEMSVVGSTTSRLYFYVSICEKTTEQIFHRRRTHSITTVPSNVKSVKLGSKVRL